MMLTEVLSTLAILVPLMAFIYSLHRDQRRRFEALEQRMDRRFAAIDQRFAEMERKFDAVNARIDALMQPHIKLVNH